MWIHTSKQLFNFFHCLDDAHFDDQIFEFILVDDTVWVDVHWFENLSEGWEELFVLEELEV